MIRVRTIDRMTGMTIFPIVPPTAKQIEARERAEEQAFDQRAQDAVEGRG